MSVDVNKLKCAIVAYRTHLLNQELYGNDLCTDSLDLLIQAYNYYKLISNSKFCPLDEETLCEISNFIKEPNIYQCNPIICDPTTTLDCNITITIETTPAPICFNIVIND